MNTVWLVFVFLLSPFAYGQWEHTSGSKIIDTDSEYAFTPHPGGVDGHTMVYDSTNSYLYVFGGYGYDDSSSSGSLNDLWQYDILSNTWEHKSGSKSTNTASEYTSPLPGGVYSHTMVFDSANNYLYVFGGSGYDGYLNDLWQYDILSYAWVHKSGSKSTNTASEYISSPLPGGVHSHTMAYDSANNYLYVFGGIGYDGSSYGRLNDLWQYDILSNTWAHKSGSKSKNTASEYTSSPHPGGVYSHTMAYDSANNYLYIFGGSGYDDTNYGSLNDLWQYDIFTSTWEHKSGSMNRNIASEYTSSPLPGGVYSHTMVFDSANSYLYVFGGSGYDGSSSGHLNDLWQYDIFTYTWEHKSGSKSTNTDSEYTSSPLPGGLHSQTMIYETNSYLYVFGGSGYDSSVLNDLWIYDLQATTTSLTTETTTISTYSTQSFLTTEDETTTIYSTVVSSQPLISTEYLYTSDQQLSTQSSLTTKDETTYSKVVSSQIAISTASTQLPLTSEMSQSTVNIINNDNISNTTIIDDTNDDGSENAIVIDGSQISSTGSVSIYTDIVLQGGATITTSKCISAFNNSQIIIDLDSRSKPDTVQQDKETVLSYNCLTIPDLEVTIQGSYTDGCIPRYEVQQTSLILIFDTPSCQSKADSKWVLPLLIGAIILVFIVISLLLIIVFTNESIRNKIFNNRTTDAGLNEEMTNLSDKMKLVDEQIASTTARVDKLNAMLDG